MLQTGQILNQRYRIVALIGQGGFGAVYRASDINLNMARAVKENLDTSPEAQQQFQREAQILAGLRHPNLPAVTDYFFIPGLGQYLVMDFVEGQDLEQVRQGQGGKLDVGQVLNWVGQVCQALAYLHSQNPAIIHRDIKPANIKITPQGKAVLVDFGISKIYDPRLRTTVGARAITPGYSPIEQYGQGQTDARSDIYALGATLYHLFTGRNPPSAKERFLNPHQLQKPTSIVPQLSQKVAESLLWAMEMHPEDRPESMALFAQALLGNGRRPMKTTPPLFNQELGEALRANQTLLIFALTLFLLAILLTML